MNNVEMRGFGKLNSRVEGISPSIFEPGLRFLSTWLKNILQNSSIYETYGYGISIEGSNNVQIINNILYNQIQYGIKAILSNNLYLSNNIITDSLIDYDELTTKNQISNGLYIQMTSTLTLDKYNLTIVNNKISSFQIGFSIPTQLCISSSPIKFNDNIAHGNDKGFLFFFPDKNCSLISNLLAYKNKEALYSFYSTTFLIVKDLLLSDNRLAINLNKATLFDYSWTKIFNISIIGLAKPACKMCRIYDSLQCQNLTAFQLEVTLANPKNYPPDQTLINNWNFVDYFTNFDDQVFIESVQIINFFNDETSNCSGVTLFKTNKYASDYTSIHFIKKIVKINSNNFIYGFFDTPDPLWISPKYCGDFQCTGLKNFLIKDLDGSLFATPSVFMPQSNTSIASNSVCQTLGDESSGLLCESLDFAILLIDSLDIDKMTRSLAPVLIENKEMGFKTYLNGYMDHFYNIYTIYSYRYNRFPGILKLNASYNVSFNQAPAVRTRIKLTGATNDDYVKIRLFFAQGTKKIMIVSYAANFSQIPNSMLFKDQVNESKIQCGRNYLDPELKYIEVVLTGHSDCVIQVAVTNSIIFQLRLEEPVEDFLANYANFLDILTKYLNINSTIFKPLNIKSGSSIVSFALTGSSADILNEFIEAEKQELLSLLRNMKEGLISGDLSFGTNVEILNYTTSMQESSVVSQGSSNVINEVGTCNINKSTENAANNMTNATIIVINNNKSNETYYRSNSSNNSKNLSDIAFNETNSNIINLTNETMSNSSQENNTKNNNVTKTEDDSSFVKIGIIVGSILVALVLIVVFGVCLKRWLKRRGENTANYTDQDLEIVNRYYVKKPEY